MKVLIGSDAHIPYHNPKGIAAFIRCISLDRPDIVIFNGDLVDFESLSRFLKNDRKASAVEAELIEGRRVLSRIRAAAGKAKCYFLEGNHEERLKKFILRFAQPLADLTLFRMGANNMLGVPGWLFPARQYLSLGRLFVHHGVSFGPSTNARNLDKYPGRWVVQGHSHRLSITYRTTTLGTVAAAEGGCLCDLNPNYTTHPNWQTGWIGYGPKGLKIYTP